MSLRQKLVRVDLDLDRVLGVLDVGTWQEDQVIDFAFNRSFTTCAVALYTSGVVLAIDVEAFQVTHRAETAESLRGIAILDDGRFRGSRMELGSLHGWSVARASFLFADSLRQVVELAGA